MQMESETGTGVGLFNVNRRLMMTFGDQAALKITSKQNKGTVISFRIPKLGVNSLMRTIRALIVDDERYAREELTYLLSKFPGVQVVGEAESGEAAILKALQLQPDVVFLDVEMPKMNGMEVAKTLVEFKKVPLIIFATAYPQFAAEAFRINAIDYLLKPYDEEQLKQTISSELKRQLYPATSQLTIRRNLGNWR